MPHRQHRGALTDRADPPAPALWFSEGTGHSGVPSSARVSGPSTSPAVRLRNLLDELKDRLRLGEALWQSSFRDADCAEVVHASDLCWQHPCKHADAGLRRRRACGSAAPASGTSRAAAVVPSRATPSCGRSLRPGSGRRRTWPAASVTRRASAGRRRTAAGGRRSACSTVSIWAIRASRSSAEWSNWAGATLAGRPRRWARTSLMRCETSSAVASGCGKWR